MTSTLKDTQSAVPTVAFLEGFMLYSAPDSKSPLRPVQEQIQLPLFLPAGYSAMKARREGRSGYVTTGPAPVTDKEGVVGGSGKKEGEEIDLEAEDDRPPQNFWVDPPGYVDDVVWPRYVEEHEWLLIADEGAPGIRISIDPRTGSIVLLGLPEISIEYNRTTIYIHTLSIVSSRFKTSSMPARGS